MFGRLRKHLSFANVASALALFIALGGAAYAGAELSKNSVGSAQIEKNAVGASEVKNGALSCAEFKAAKAPCAPTTVRSLTVTLPLTCAETNPFAGQYFLNCSSPKQAVKAPCGSGEHATGGGYNAPTGGTAGSGPVSSATVTNSRPDPDAGTPDGWTVDASGAGSNVGSAPGLAHPPDPQVTVYAVCSL
jgi:hypothetical protein